MAEGVSSWLAGFTGILPLVVGLVLVALAWFVYRTARSHSFNVVFAALYFLSGLKSFSEAILPRAEELHAQAPLFPAYGAWFSVSFLCAYFMLPLLLLFVLLFPTSMPWLRRRPTLGVLLFLPTFVFTYLSFLPDVVPLHTIISAFNLVSTVGALAAIALLARTYATTQDPIGRTRAAYVLGAFSANVAASLFVSLLNLLGSPLQVFFLEWITPLVELVVAAVTGYAILKYQILGIELRVKAGTKYAVTGALTVVVLFVANNTFQKLVEPVFAFTNLSFLLAALAATIVFYPLQRGVGKITNRLFPAAAAPPAAYESQRSREIYHAQVAYVLRDLEMTERERKFLDNLRAQLKLSVKDARAVESDVAKIVAAETGKARARRARSPAA